MSEDMDGDDMEPEDVLDAAADYLKIFGWMRGIAGEDGGPRCAMGAVWSVVGVSPSSGRAAKLLMDSQVIDNIGVWNDRRGRTCDEVVDAMRTAAARRRLGEL